MKFQSRCVLLFFALLCSTSFATKPSALTLTNFPLPGEGESFLPDSDSQTLYLFDHETNAPRDQAGSQRHLLFYFYAGAAIAMAGRTISALHPQPSKA
jgi:hypothetical protein